MPLEPLRPAAILFVVAGLTLSAAAAGRQVVLSTDGTFARDATPPPKGTGVVMGRAIDASSGRPIGDVVVTMSSSGLRTNASYEPVITDSEGRFVVRDLPKGLFTFHATKPGYVPGAYGKPVPIGYQDSGQSLDLADDDRVGNVIIKLWKYASIDGVVTDETGDPIVGIDVRALPRRAVAGRVQFAFEQSVVPYGVYTTTTDDRGMYRLDTIPPGDYVVAVPVIAWAAPKARPAVSTSPVDATSTSSTGLWSWLGGARGGGMGVGTLDAGDDLFGFVHSASPAGVRTPGLAGLTADGRALVYETQYFPGTPSLGRAATLTIGSGEARSAVDFRLKPVPAFKIAGTVTGPAGPVPSLTLRLVSADMTATSSDPEVGITTTDSVGRFAFLGVTPGQYAIRSLNVPRPQRATPSASAVQTTGGTGTTVFIGGGGGAVVSDDPVLWTDTPIALSDRDVRDVAVEQRAGLRISGRVEFDGTSERPAANARRPTVTIARADGKRGSNYTQQEGLVDAEWRLKTYGQVPGKYILLVNWSPPGWHFAGAFAGGRDVSIVPLELSTVGIDNVVLKFTDKPLASLSGTVTNSRGEPDETAKVIVFTADRQQWFDTGPSPRTMRAVGTVRGGRYTAGNLPAGDYFVTALAELPILWAESRSLEALARTASRVTVRDHENAFQDLRMPSRAPVPAATPTTSAAIVSGAAGDGIRPSGPFVDPGDEPQTRDAPIVPATGTGRISGLIVLDAQRRTPAPRVYVTLASSVTVGTRTVITNETGRFEFPALPAGRYVLTANKAAYLSVSYGATRIGGASTPIVLTEGQQLTGISLHLQKGGVITGVIRDERGQPLQGVSVHPMQYRTQPTGERRLFSTRPEDTDSRGVYRLFGLAPGEYVVGASIRYAASNAHPTSVADVQYAQQALQRGATTAAAPTRQSTVRYAPVLYPGVLTTDGAQSIKVGVGEERTGIDFALRTVPTVWIDGTVANPSGPLPPNLDVRLLSVGEAIPVTSLDLGLALPVRPSADGRFSYSGVGPGRYVVAAMTQPAAGRAGRGSADPSATLWGSAEVDVNGTNVSNIAITLQPGMTVVGTLRFEGTTLTPPADLGTQRVFLSPVVSSGQVAIGQTSATAGSDGSFTFAGLTPGRYNLRSTPPVGWQQMRVAAAGQDALDAPFELKPGENVSDALIVFGDRPAEITGMLQDTSGRPATDYFIVVLAADPAKWRSTNRRVQQVRPSSDGTFVFRNMLPGDYVLAAATDLEPGIPSDPELLAELARGGVKVTLAAGEKKTQDIKVGR